MVKKISALERFLLLLTGLLAAYQIAIGIEGMSSLSVISYTVAFGILLVAGLLLIILGFEILESPPVVIVSTLIPLSLSLGLVSQYLPHLRNGYLVFVIAGLGAVILTRYSASQKTAVGVLAAVHGVSGLLIFVLPLAFSLNGSAPAGFALVGLGGALIGIGGLLLSFLKAGKPLLSRERILSILPGLLLLTTAAFVAGFAMA